MKKYLLLFSLFFVFVVSSYAQTISLSFPYSKVLAGCQTKIYFTTASLPAGTTISAYLSDSNGGFANPILIGSSTTSPITVTIPANYQGSSYRIKLYSDTPFVESNLGTSFEILSNVFPTSSNNIICNSSPSTLTAPAVDSCTYQWLRDNVVIPGATNLTYSTNQSGGYVCRYTTNSNCSRISNSIFLNKPYANLSYSSSQYCAGTTATITAFGSNSNVNYVWKKDGLVLPGVVSQSIVINSTGVYSVDITYPNCETVSSSTNTITFGNTFSININSPVSTLCQGSTTLTANVIFTGTNLSYQWIKDGLDILGATANTLTAIQSGEYSVKATAGTCKATTNFPTRVKIGDINLNVSSSGNLCGNVLVNLNASAQGGLTYTYQWYKNNVPLALGTSPTYAAALPGIYSVIVNSGACAKKASISVLSELPTPFISTVNNTNTTTCLGSINISLNNASQYSQMSYQWYLDGNIIAGASQTTYSASQTGYYTLKVYNNNCSAITSVIFLSFNKLPQFYLNGNCNNGLSTVSTSGNGNINYNDYTFQWYKNELPVLNATLNTLTISSDGFYKAKISQGNCSIFTSDYLASGNLCSPSTNTQNNLVYIYSNGSTQICDGDGVLLYIGSSETGTYQWKKDGVNIPDAINRTYVAKQIGVYTLEFNNGINSRTSGSITVTTLANVNIFGKSSACGNQFYELNISNTSTYSGETYQWYRDGAVLPNEVNRSLVTELFGTYTVAVFRNNGQCTINSLPFPVSNSTLVTINAPRTNLCQGNSLLTSSTSITSPSYQWRKDGVDIPGAIENSYNALTPGSYSLRLTSSLCGTVTSNVLVLTNTPVAQNVFNRYTMPICSTGGVNYLEVSPNNSLATFIWKLNGVILPNETQYNIRISAPGVYAATTTVNSCVLTSSITVTASDNLSAFGSQNTTVCPGSTFEVYSFPNANNTQWFKNDILLSTNTIIIISEPGLYYSIIQNGGCSVKSRTFSVSNNVQKPEINSFYPNSNTVVCGNSNTYNLFVNNTNNSSKTYVWKKNGLVIPNATSQSISSNDQNAEYTVVVTDGTCQNESLPLKVTNGILNGIGIFDTDSNPNCGLSTKRLRGTSTNGFSYQWFRDGLSIPFTTSNSIQTSIAGDYYLRSTLGACVVNSNVIQINNDPCPCLNSYISSKNIFNGPIERKVNGKILSAEFINSGVLNTYKASESITLSPGFTTNQYVIFKAEIENCTN